MLSRHHICMGPRRRMLLQGNRHTLPMICSKHVLCGHARKRLEAAQRSYPKEIGFYDGWNRCIAAPSKDIPRPPRHNHTQIVIPRQGGKHIFASHIKPSTSRDFTCRTSASKMWSPRSAGSSFSQPVPKSAVTCRVHDNEKFKKNNKSFGDFQKTSFSSILAAEVLQNTELARPRSMGIKQNNASHLAWESHFWVLQHP